MRFSQMPIKDKIMTCCTLFILWFIATAIGCLIGIVLLNLNRV